MKKIEFIGDENNIINSENNDSFPFEKLLEYFLSERNISFILIFIKINL